MKRYECYYLNDFRDDYPASSREDKEGDWYSVEDVHALLRECLPHISEQIEFDPIANKFDVEKVERARQLRSLLQSILANG